ncbi:hypothetical protein LSO9J_520001 [Candidatus Liberibacter solanacearum]
MPYKTSLYPPRRGGVKPSLAFCLRYKWYFKWISTEDSFSTLKEFLSADGYRMVLNPYWNEHIPGFFMIPTKITALLNPHILIRNSFEIEINTVKTTT